MKMAYLVHKATGKRYQVPGKNKDRIFPSVTEAKRFKKVNQLKMWEVEVARNLRGKFLKKGP